MTEFQVITELIKSLGVGTIFAPAISLVLLIYILKKYVFAGWGAIIQTTITGFFERERRQVAVQTEVAASLQEIVHQLESLTSKVSDEIKDSTERIRTLEMVMSDYLDEFRELNERLILTKQELKERPCLENIPIRGSQRGDKTNVPKG